MSFSAKDFLSKSDLTHESVDDLTKDELIAFADPLGIKVFGWEKKGIYFELFVKLWLLEGFIEEDPHEVPTDPKSQVEVLKLQLHLKEVEKELETLKLNVMSHF